jgi:tetratricopeptide (TPR) repeat protein
MEELPAKVRSGVETQRRGYSDEEVAHIYELGRFFLENGDFRRADTIMRGITEVAPDFAPGWLARSYIHIQAREYDEAIQMARQAFRCDPDMVEAVLYLAACLLTTGDYNAAGTYLGEVGEKIDGGAVDNPDVIRFYKSQLARYQSR